jgi:hypothetical protein
MSVTKRIPIAIGIKPNAVTTFTNKTIDGTQNTLQNIPTNALQFNTISINGSTIPLGGSINLQVEGGIPIIDTNTTYGIKASTVTSGASLDLDAGGSGAGTDSVNFIGAGNVSVTRIDANTIRISDAGTLGGVALTADNTAILTNKTISGSSNTLTNIPNSALSNSFITINGNQVSLGGSITVESSGGGSGDITSDSITTFRNKTISGSNNNLLNIPNNALVNPFISINGNEVSLGQNFNVSGLGDVTTDGVQDLTNKSLLSPIIQSPNIIGALKVGTQSGGNPGISGQVLKSTGSGIIWDYETRTTAASLVVGSGLSSIGGNTFDGSNGITISINTGVVATLTGNQTLENKTFNNCSISGSANTITNIPNSALTNSNFTLNGQSISLGDSVNIDFGGGTFNGPASSTNNAVMLFDGTSGSLAKNSLVTISNDGAITAPSTSSIIPFYHSNNLSLPDATTYNGAVAVTSNNNSLYFAANGTWFRVAKESEASIQTRQTFSTTTTSLVNNGVAYPTITNSLKSYLLLKIQTDRAAWVRVYTSTAARNADTTRSIDVDPLPGSGVIAEVITTGASTQILTPAVIGFNDDATPVNTIYLSVTNRSGVTGTVTVTLTALKLEA